MTRHALVFSSLAILALACSTGPRVPFRDGGPGGSLDGSTRQDGDITGGRDGSTNPPNPNLGTGVVRGQVWAPGNAPGMVPAGEEIPIFGALVRLSAGPLPAIPDGAYCEQCVDVNGLFTESAHTGSFVIERVPAGHYWLSVQKGQFRIETEIDVADDQDVQAGAEWTTLPSVHDPANGRYVPRIAVAAGDYDSLEDVLGKMSIGAVDSSGSFELGPGSERIDFYDNGGENYSSEIGSFESLVRDLSAMLQYHVIFIPCSDETSTGALDDPAVLRNIREYVAAGGKLYVTDWSGEWMDNVFPAHVQLEEGADTPASAYDPASMTWSTGQFGDADGSSYDSENAEAQDPDLRQWLHGQRGPAADDPDMTIDYDSSRFFVEGNWNTVMGLHPVIVGTDEDGAQIIDTPVAWVIGGEDNDTPKRPLTVTFEPAGCGRVLYSTYHTTDTTHVGLAPQERILLYLIMQIGVCKDGPILI